MVAKTLWSISLAFALTACQTIPVQQPEKTAEPVKIPQAILKAEQQTNVAKKPLAEPVVAQQQAPTEQVEIEQVVEPEVIDPNPEKVVLRLQQEALQLQSEGQWQAAELKLERALRIDADKVDVYHQLATVRMGQQRFAQAEQIALKGLTLTNQTAQHKSALWEVIAQCKSAQGDIAGAKQARKEMLKWLE